MKDIEIMLQVSDIVRDIERKNISVTVKHIEEGSLCVSGAALYTGYTSEIKEYVNIYNSITVGFRFKNASGVLCTIAGMHEDKYLIKEEGNGLGCKILDAVNIVDEIFLFQDYSKRAKLREESKRRKQEEEAKENDIDGFASEIKKSSPMRYARIIETLNKDNRKKKVKELLKEGYKPAFRDCTNIKTGVRKENVRVLEKGGSFYSVNKTVFEYAKYLIKRYER